MPGQYPFQDASQGLGGMNQASSHIALALAQRKYQQQIAMARLAQIVQAEQDRKQNYLAHQQEVNAQQGYMKPYYEAQTSAHSAQAGLDTSKAAIESARLDSANQAGDAFGRESVPYVNPLEAGQGPTNVGAQFMSDQENKRRMLSQVLRGLMLASSPNPERATDFQSGQQALGTMQPMSPGLASAILTKTHSAIPVGHQGGVYDPTQGTMTSMMPQLVPPGNMLVPGQGGNPLAMSPNKPLNPGNPLASLQGLLGHFTAGGYASNPSDPTYQATTNAINRILPNVGVNPQQPTSNSAQSPPPVPGSKIVIQNGQRFQVNPDGSSIHLGPQ